MLNAFKVPLQDPEHERVDNGTFTIPDGFLVGMVKNVHETNPLKLINRKGKEMILEPGDVYYYTYTGKAKSAIIVDATSSSAFIGYEV